MMRRKLVEMRRSRKLHSLESCAHIQSADFSANQSTYTKLEGRIHEKGKQQKGRRMLDQHILINP